MLYAVSGSQGSGKSTVLAGLEERGYRVLKRKISRSILADWDVTLDEVNSDIELTLEFQDEIIKRKFADEQDAAQSRDVYFTERTYTDSFVYYLFSFGKVSSFDTQITEYYRQCEEFNQSYDKIFYLPSGKFPPVADGVRGTNSYYVESIDVALKHYLDKTLADKLRVVTQITPEDRIEYIENETWK